MDALEFCKTKKRMCETYVACNNCPLLCTMGDCLLGTTDLRLDKEIIDVVEKWGEEHPMKSRQAKFLKLHPNALIGDETGVLEICPLLVGNDVDCDANTSCKKCRIEYWLGGVNNDTE